MPDKNLKLDTSSYKGVRDFYPEDMAVQEFIFDAMSNAAEQYGYEKYDASILEPTDLYRAKTGEEIINEQTYSFLDRGEREVTLRPEMTPTVARMVAAKRRELPLPIRWYSIPNLFRYERPQKGRLREHYQLNVDIFGAEGVEAEIEVISVARKVLLNLGLKDENFKVRVSDRTILRGYLSKLGLDAEKTTRLEKLIDRKNKIDDFELQAKEIAGPEFNMEALAPNENLEKVITRIRELGGQIEFDPYIVRGFDYYTGTVFEFYDTGSENNRSICGGGRYDELLSIFGVDALPTVGFGMGDVIARDLLETYGLLPKYASPNQLEICPLREEFFNEAAKFAEHLRSFDLKVSTNLTSKSLGDKIKSADRRKVPYIIALGDDEIKTGQYKLKNLQSGEEVVGDISQIVQLLKH